MKKTIFFVGCLALLMAGCNKVEMVETPVDEPAMEAPRHLTVNISVNHADDTRSVKTGWEVGDVIYVAFDHFFTEEPITGNSSSVVYYMTLTYDGTVWQSAFSNEALEQYLMEGGSKTGSLAAVYMSDMVPVFEFLKGIRGTREDRMINLKNDGSCPGFYMFDDQCSYSVSNGVLTASLSMHLYNQYIHFFVPGLSTVISGDPNPRYVLTSEKINSCHFGSIGSSKVGDGDFSAPIVDRATRPTTGSQADVVPAAIHSDGAVFCGSLSNINYLGQEQEYVIRIVDRGHTNSQWDDIEYKLTKTATLYGNEAIVLPPLSDSRWVKSYVNYIDGRGITNGHEWVEIAGIKWATVNVGGDRDHPNTSAYFSWSDARNIQNNEYWSWGDGWRLATIGEWLKLETALSHPTYSYALSFAEAEGIFYGLQLFPIDSPNAINKLFFPRGSGYMDAQNNFVNGETGIGYYWADFNNSIYPAVFSVDPNQDVPVIYHENFQPVEGTYMFIRLVAD